MFNPDVLERLATKVDTSHIMLGCDYPFGECEAGGVFGDAPGKFPRRRVDAMLGANAAKFLGVRI